jgi:hypothetical protein
VRSRANVLGSDFTVICALADTVTDRLPSADAAMNCVYPGVLPACP